MRWSRASGVRRMDSELLASQCGIFLSTFRFFYRLTQKYRQCKERTRLSRCFARAWGQANEKTEFNSSGQRRAARRRGGGAGGRSADEEGRAGAGEAELLRHLL